MRKLEQGFTLIELVIVIVVLGLVSVGISSFVKSSADMFVDVTERERLLREGSFVVERLNRELASAVPNSARVVGNASVHCLQFVPQKWSTFYLNAPMQPSSDDILDVVEMRDVAGNMFVPASNIDQAIIYPTRWQQVYDANLNHRQTILSCSDDGDGDCATGDDSDAIIQLTVADAFALSSPAKRVYIADSAVSYCVLGNALYRHVSAISPIQTLFTSGGVLMAENVANTLSANVNSPGVNTQLPFRVIDATLRRNAYTQVQLIFQREDEFLNFSQEIHVPNVP